MTSKKGEVSSLTVVVCRAEVRRKQLKLSDQMTLSYPVLLYRSTHNERWFMIVNRSMEHGFNEMAEDHL